MLKDWKQEYLDIIDSIELKQITELAQRLMESDEIYFAGNGGSYGNVTHMAGDMLINSELDASIHAIGDNFVAFTALCNDQNYTTAMAAEYLRRRRWNGRATVVLLSTSGKSKNIIDLATVACDQGDDVVIITGSEPDPWLASRSVLHIKLAHTDAGLLESVYDFIGHLLIMEVNRLYKEQDD